MSVESPKATSKVAQAAQSRPQLPASCDPPGEGNPPKQSVWVVFGATGQMGRSLVHSALTHNDLVTAVGRTFEHTPEQMQGWHPNCEGMLCDVRVRETVDDVLKGTIARFGRIDIIANCTGYGIISPAEDQSPNDLYDQFATNFMGTLHILQLSLPYFRAKNLSGSVKSPSSQGGGKKKRKPSNSMDSEASASELRGRYLIFSSTAGSLGVPGMASYCATKYAVEGLIESMLYEVHCFGIKATLVEPGHMRDDDTAEFATKAHNADLSMAAGDPISPIGTSSDPTRARKRFAHFHIRTNPSAPYTSLNSPSMHALRTMQWLDKRQPVSTERSADLCWQLAHCNYPPLRLLLGSFAVDSIRDRLRCVTEEIEDWKFLSFGPSPSTTTHALNSTSGNVAGRSGNREPSRPKQSQVRRFTNTDGNDDDYDDDEADNNAGYDNDDDEEEDDMVDMDDEDEEAMEESDDNDEDQATAMLVTTRSAESTAHQDLSSAHSDVAMKGAGSDQGWDENQMPVIYHAMHG